MIQIKLTKIEAERTKKALAYYAANAWDPDHSWIKDMLFTRKSGTVRTCVGVIDKIDKGVLIK